MVKKVVFINQSTGYLMIDIVNAYHNVYDKVVLIAGSIREMQRPLNSETEIKKIIAYNRKSSFTRIASWVIGTFQIFFKLLFHYKNHEIVFVTNPPLIYLLAPIFRRKYSVIVYDTYPDALKNIGINPNHLLYKAWAKRNRNVFHKASKVYTLSESMSKLLEQYVEKEKIKVIYNWAGSDSFSPIPKEENIFVQKHNLTNKFVILYSGNIGYTHNIDTILSVAELFVLEKDICFLFIGEGKKKKELVETIEKLKLENCKYMTWQDRETLPYSLASADLGVVTLNDESGMLSVPSKTYNLLACGIPLLSIAPKHSELSNLISTYQNGKNFSTDQVSKIADFILQCKENKDFLKELSNNSLKASKEFTYNNAKQYL